MSAIRRLLRWWLAELAAMLPRALRGGGGEGRTLLVEVDDDTLDVSVDDGGERRELARFPRGGEIPEAARAALAAEAAAAARGATRVVARFAPGLVLRRRVSLPAAASENLREVIGFELHRLTPFRSDDVHFEYRRLPPGRDPAVLEIELTLLRRSLLAPVQALLAPAVFRPAGVVEASDDGALALRLATQAPRRRAGTLLGRIVWAVNAMLLAAVALLPLHQLDARVAALEARVAEARERAEAAVSVRERADRLEARRAWLLERKRGAVPGIEVIRELTELLPDSAWLQRLEIDGAAVSVNGTADAASALVAAIEDSPLFQRPTFPSPVTHSATTGREQFRLNFEITAR